MLDKSNLAKNTLSLGVIQCANFIIPLLLLPFLSRSLGVEGFGDAVFVLAVIQLSVVLTEYGFSLYATYEIAKNKSRTCVNRLIGRVYIAKVILFIGAAAVVVLLEVFRGLFDPFLIVFSILSVLGMSYQPIWFFQGISKMYRITVYILVSKIAYALLVLLIVDSPNDLGWVLFAWAVAQLAGAALSNVFVYKEGYAIGKASLAEGVLVLRESKSYFLSRVAVALYTTCNTIFLGMLGDPRQVAIYGVADQFYRAGQNVTMPLSQALFPYMTATKDWNTFFKLVFVVAVLIVLACCIGYYVADDLIIFVMGDDFSESYDVLVILMMALVFNYLAVSFGYPAFAALGKPEYPNVSVFVGAVVHVVVLGGLYFSDNMDYLTVAGAVVLTELLVMLLRVVGFRSMISKIRAACV